MCGVFARVQIYHCFNREESAPQNQWKVYASNYFYGRFSTLKLQMIHNEMGQNDVHPETCLLLNSLCVCADGCVSSIHTLTYAPGRSAVK